MRQPIHIEVRGLQTPRERIWAAVMQAGANGQVFDRLGVQDLCNPMVRFTAVADYLQALQKGGYIAHVHSRPVPRTSVAHSFDYTLLKPSGTAPRINIYGQPVVQGTGTQAMWQAMKVLAVFDFHAIARAATLGDLVVPASTAKAYIKALAHAGYLVALRTPKPGTATQYRLGNNTGPHAPAITRVKTVFDRNTGEFTHLQTKQEVCDGLV
jgi:hypothetical protein